MTDKKIEQYSQITNKKHIKNCSECPCMGSYSGHGEGWDECQHPLTPGGYSSIIKDTKSTPDWCPIMVNDAHMDSVLGKSKESNGKLHSLRTVYLAIKEAMAEKPAQVAGFDVVIDASMPPNTMKFVQPAQPQDYWEEQPDGSLIPVDPTEMQSEQEPVAWRFIGIAGLKRYMTQRQYDAQTQETKKWYEPFKCANCTTSQPASKPLTEKQRKNMGDKYGGKLHGPDSAAFWYFKGVDDTEAAHGIKGDV